jgi:hypothetical protein
MGFTNLTLRLNIVNLLNTPLQTRFSSDVFAKIVPMQFQIREIIHIKADNHCLVKNNRINLKRMY